MWPNLPLPMIKSLEKFLVALLSLVMEIWRAGSKEALLLTVMVENSSVVVVAVDTGFWAFWDFLRFPFPHRMAKKAKNMMITIEEEACGDCGNQRLLEQKTTMTMLCCR